MTFEAKLLSPLPCDPDMADDVFADTASGGVALIDAPEGYLLTGDCRWRSHGCSNTRFGYAWGRRTATQRRFSCR